MCLFRVAACVCVDAEKQQVATEDAVLGIEWQGLLVRDKSCLSLFPNKPPSLLAFYLSLGTVCLPCMTARDQERNPLASFSLSLFS